jgi:hypothetical protein
MIFINYKIPSEVVLNPLSWHDTVFFFSWQDIEKWFRVHVFASYISNLNAYDKLKLKVQ